MPHGSHQRPEARRPPRDTCHPVRRRKRRLPRDEATSVLIEPEPMSQLSRTLLPGSRYGVRQVACGVMHCLVLATELGTSLAVFAWGRGEFGQLGLGTIRESTALQPLVAPTDFATAIADLDRDPTQICLRSGPWTSCLVINGPEGTPATVWLWGLTPDTSTENPAGPPQYQDLPRADLLRVPFGVEDLGLGHEHVVLLSTSGELFSWGRGAWGQLGLGRETRVVPTAAPQLITVPDAGLRFGAVACGTDHSLAVTRDGRGVFAWGSNRLGACGARTKFHSYFHPVRVAVADEDTGSDARDEGSRGRSFEVSCRGGTTVCTSRAEWGPTASPMAVVQVHVWGITSPDTVELLPRVVSTTVVGDVEPLSSLRAHAGFGMVYGRWTVPSSADGDPAALYQIDNRPGHEVVRPGQRHLIRLSSIVRDINGRNEPKPGRHGQNHRLVRLLPAPAADDADGELPTVRVLDGPQSSESACDPQRLTVDLEITARGRSPHLAVLLGPVPIINNVLHVAALDASEDDEYAQDLPLPMSTTESASRFQWLGLSRLDASGGGRLGELRWHPLRVGRVRVFQGDWLVLLLLLQKSRSTSTDEQLSLGLLQPAQTSSVTTLIPGHQVARVGSLGVVAFVLQVSELGIAHVALGPTASTTTRPSLPEPSSLVVVECCMHPRERRAILRGHREFLHRALTAVTSPSGDRDQRGITADSLHAFSRFRSLVLHHDRVRDAVAWSPLMATPDEARESDWDLDCARQAGDDDDLIQRRPTTGDCFRLWRRELDAIDDKDDDDYDHTETPQSESVNGVDVLTLLRESPLEALDPSDVGVVATALAATIVRSLFHDTPTPQPQVELSLQEAEALDEARERIPRAVGIHVPQSPGDFLVRGDHSSPSIATTAVTLANVAGVVETPPPSLMRTHSIRAWWNEHGDLFYSTTGAPATSPNAIEVHLDDDAADVDPTRTTRQRRWQRAVHAFLWRHMRARSNAELFALLANARPTGDPPSLTVEELVAGLQRLGLPTQAFEADEWFALLAGLQELDARRRGPRSPHGAARRAPRFTLTMLELFLVDPFHAEFWRRYLATWADAVGPTTDPATHVTQGWLLRAFTARQVDSVATPRAAWMHWADFAEGLGRLHGLAGLPLDPADAARVLYRFDLRRDGRIAIEDFQRWLMAATSDRRHSRRPGPQGGDGHRPVAILTRRPPNVDAFGTPAAVRKLYKDRGSVAASEAAAMPSPASPTAARLHGLLRLGNTRLAEIRSLPVSRLLSEGVHFRPRSCPPRRVVVGSDQEDDNGQRHEDAT